MKAYERLLQYVSFPTQSSETSGTHPSTAGQFDLARHLAKEMTGLGLSDVRVDEKCYVYGRLPATPGYEKAVSLGLIAHMDTSPDASGSNIHPVLHKNYDGKELDLGNGRKLSPALFPHLSKLAGRTLITTDGSTLLGADDKAGISEIMTALEILVTEKIPHGEIPVAFTPDEEIGEGADYFDVPAFGADFAYTVDGGPEGSLEYENFNAASAKFDIVGRSVHPGSAKDIMVNAALVAMEINSMLPAGDVPARTEKYEGFFHVTGMSGEVEHANISYIVRDHDAATFDVRLGTLRHIGKVLNEKYGKGTVTLTIKEQYRNMKEKIAPCMHLIENAVKASEACGAEPTIEAIRGGTDGARLSYMGLPCPNLGTGGYAFHGPMEHITVEGMDIQVNILLELIRIYSRVGKDGKVV